MIEIFELGKKFAPPKKWMAGWMGVRIPYDPALIAAVKCIPASLRRFDGENKIWLVAPRMAWTLPALFADAGVALNAIEAPAELMDLSQRRAEAGAYWRENKQTILDRVQREMCGLNLFNHQFEDLSRLLHARRGILAHAPGLGKTKSGLLAGYCTGLPVYVIAPKSTHDVAWRKAARELGVKVSGVFSWAKIPNVQEIPQRHFTLIADESHFIKDPERKRSRAFLDLAKYADFLFLLSGTPLRNDRPIELLTQLESIEHEISFDFFSYAKKFCGAEEVKMGKKKFWDFSGCTNLAVLKASIADKVFFRTKKQCTDLPEKTYEERSAEISFAGLPNEREIEQEYEKALLAVSAREEAEAILHEQGIGSDEIESYLNALKAFGEFVTLRRLTSLGKCEATVETAMEILGSDEPLVIFCDFLNTVKRLKELFKARGFECSEISGEVTGHVQGSNGKLDRRAEEVRRFASGETKVCIITQAGGVGVDGLQIASYMLLHDLLWVPGDMEQVEDRLHRINQKTQVTVIKVLSGNVMDEILQSVLYRKNKMLGAFYREAEVAA